MGDAQIAAATAWVLENGMLLYYATIAGSISVFALLEVIGRRPGTSVSRSRRWPTNLALLVTAYIAQLLVPFSGLAVAFWVHENRLGLLNVIELPLVITAIATFVAADLVAYFRHVLMHKLPLLWRVHRVHHTDSAVDITTFGRFHPLEVVPELAIMLPAILVLGLSPAALFLYELCSITFNVLAHANVRVPRACDEALRTIVVTPDMHQIHHSSWQPCTDSNYGVVLTIWDRLCGTYRQGALADEPVSIATVGLRDLPEPQASSFLKQLMLPFVSLAPPRPITPRDRPQHRRKGGRSRDV